MDGTCKDRNKKTGCTVMVLRKNKLKTQEKETSDDTGSGFLFL
jgi:hypothetical protein